MVTENTNTEKADAECFEAERNNADKANALCFGNGQTDGLNSSGDVSRSLNCMHDPMGVCENVTEPNYIVRRLTPTEAERLQGFPDGWTDIGEYTDTNGKKRKTCDSNRYKALGNSIATVAWVDVLQGIAYHCEAKTMSSLFDGIGGFPLIWERNCGGKAVWASEIEEFPIAVTKRHFPE